MTAALELGSSGWQKLAVLFLAVAAVGLPINQIEAHALLLAVAVARYHFLTWFLTMLVVMVFMHEVAIDWLLRRYPAASGRTTTHPLPRRLASGLAWLQKSSA